MIANGRDSFEAAGRNSAGFIGSAGGSAIFARFQPESSGIDGGNARISEACARRRAKRAL
jgi:hypothetical protein